MINTVTNHGLYYIDSNFAMHLDNKFNYAAYLSACSSYWRLVAKGVNSV